MTAGLPEFYRPNVGLMLIAADRRVFVGLRTGKADAWQMPQGGVDRGETPIEAACRELKEEVGTTKALLLPLVWTWAAAALPFNDGSWFGWHVLQLPVTTPLLLLL